MSALALDAPGLEAVLADLGGDGRLVHVERLAARAARHGVTAAPVAADLAARLPGHGRLWSHQAEAIDLVRARRPVALATGTASGKSLCFQLPIAEAAADPIRPGTAVLVFPTKALAHDQLRALVALDLPGVVAATYDGDSSPEERAWVRRHANVVLTNPEMLHCALLPHHARWATFLMRLRIVVLDELHTYRGVFGTHVGHLMRRLRRLAAHYGADPTLVACSATIGSPDRLATALWGDPVTAVTDDGSPRGERLVALWNPPLVHDLYGDDAVVGREGARLSANGETALLLAELVARGHRSIGFCRSRRATEVVAAAVRRRLPDELAGAVRPYRGGYLPEERREIEAELFGGRLRGVVATNALELGIDVGGLDAVVLDGFPGTIASLWQQVGRAGRAAETSLAVLVAGEDQLDQWYMAHPEEIVRRPPEPAVVNPANPFVLHPHLACAAFELPLTPADERWWPGLLDDGVRELVQADRLRVRRPSHRRREPAAVWAARGYPSNGVGLRSGSSGEVRIVRQDDSSVGTVDAARAPELVHPGAVYLHQGVAYQVVELDLDDHTATVEPASGDDYTIARTEVAFRVLGVDAVTRVGRADLHLGAIEVVAQVTGYQRRDATSGELLDTRGLELPPSRLITRGFWYCTEESVLADAGLDRADWAGTLHAAEHAAIGLLPLFTICDRWDVGGVSTARHFDTERPTVLVYDAYPGGAGIAELGYDAADRHLGATLDLVAACPCRTGCPSCVQSPKCGNWNHPLDKPGAVSFLRRVLQRDR